jgi:hypothetical protein
VWVVVLWMPLKEVVVLENGGAEVLTLEVDEVVEMVDRAELVENVAEEKRVDDSVGVAESYDWVKEVGASVLMVLTVEEVEESVMELTGEEAEESVMELTGEEISVIEVSVEVEVSDVVAVEVPVEVEVSDVVEVEAPVEVEVSDVFAIEVSVEVDASEVVPTELSAEIDASDVVVADLAEVETSAVVVTEVAAEVDASAVVVTEVAADVDASDALPSIKPNTTPRLETREVADAHSLEYCGVREGRTGVSIPRALSRLT